MNRRGPLSGELADLIAGSITASLEHAEAFAVADGYTPAGPFADELTSIANTQADVRGVRERLHATLLETAAMHLAHAIDHVRAVVRDVQREPAPIWSQLTLCRSVQESTAWMCHLLAPSISAETRLCRIAALWLDDSKPAETAAATFGAEHAAGEAAHHGFKLTELVAGGFTIDYDPKHDHPERVGLGQAVAGLRLSMTDEITRLLPVGMPSPYRLSSGAAHARPWMLERSATRTTDGSLVGEGSTAATAAFTLMYCMIAWVKAWGGYFGIDVTRQVADISEVITAFGREGVALG